MKKTLLLLFCVSLFIFSLTDALAFLPPGTGGGDLPPLPPPLPPGDNGQDNSGVQTDVLNPIVIFSSSATDISAGTSITISINAADSGGYNTGISYFVLKENNNVIFTKQCSGAASCSDSFTFTKAKGTYYYTVDAYDVAGNKNTAETTEPDSISVTFRNRNPPAVSLIYPGHNSYVLISSPSLSWTASSDPDSDSVTYEIEIDGTIYSSSANSYQSAFSEGLHGWRVRARDSENALSEWTSARNFRTDTLIPSVSNSRAPDVELGSNAVVRVDVTDANLDKVQIEIDGTKHDMALQSGNTYVYTLASPSLGHHNIRYHASDGAGRTNSLVTDSFDVEDTTPPTILTSAQTVELGSDVSFYVNATDLSLPVLISINNENFTINSAKLITNNRTLPYGTNVIPITAYDFYNNSITQNLNVFVVDTTSPIFSPLPSNQYVEAGNSFSYDVNAVDYNAIAYSLNDTRFGINSNGLITNSTSLLVANYSLNITATDTDSNSVSSVIAIYVLDTLPPEWDNIPSNYTSEYGQPLNLSVKAFDFQNVIYAINDTIHFVIDTITGIISKAVTWIGNLDIGIYHVQVNATDASGNVNSTNIDIEIKDTTTPAIFSLVSPSNNTASANNTPIMIWTQSSDLLFNRYLLEVDDNSNFSSLIINELLNGVSNTTLQVTLPADGTFYWRVKAYDSSGNFETSDVFIYSSDALPPSLISSLMTGHNNYTFSPINLDGNYDNVNISLDASEPVKWDLFIYDSSNAQVWHRWSNNNAASFNRTWDGQASGSGGYLPDGLYTVNISMVDRVENMVNLTISQLAIDNTPPALATSTARTPDTVYGYSDVTISAIWPDVSSVLFGHNASGTWQNVTATKNLDNYSTIISHTLIDGNETIGWASYGFDDVMNVANTNISEFSVINSPPNFTQLSNRTANVGRLFTYDVSDYFYDLDGDSFEFTDNAAQFDIGLYNGIIVFTPTTEENISVLITACENISDDCVSDDFTIFVGPPFSTLKNTYLNNTYYLDETLDNVTGVYSSDLTDSNISERINISLSTIVNSTLVDSSAYNCEIFDSVLYGIDCYNQTIDPSDVRYSNIPGSDITDSHIWYSDANYSEIDGSTIDYSTINDSIIINATIQNGSIITSSEITNTTLSNTTATNSTIEDSYDLVNAVISDANITNNVLYSGTIIMFNGILYDADVSGHENLSELINLKPIADFSRSANYLSVAFTDLSFDPNVLASNPMNDLIISHLWNFGDSATSNATNIIHAYASAGTYNVVLIVTDKSGLNDSKTLSLSVSAQPSEESSSGGSSGGGGGGGGGGCLPKWECTEWSECSSDGKQARTCTDKWNCGTNYRKPAEQQNCTYIPGESEEEIEETEGAGKGIIGITGRVIGDIVDFGKSNLMFIAVLIAVIVLFVIISMKMSGGRKNRKKKNKRKGYKESVNSKIIKINNVERNKMMSIKKLFKKISNRFRNAHKAAKETAKKQERIKKKEAKKKKRKSVPIHHRIIHHVRRLTGLGAKKPVKRRKKARKPKIMPKIVEKIKTEKITKEY